jgi:uncharacterized protein (DUF58 family)
MEEQCLSRNNLYMLPTRHGILFSFVLLAMLLVAVNYSNSLAYIMSFTLFSTVLVSMLYTHRNLQGLCLAYGSCNPVFAGKLLSYTLILRNQTKRDRFDIGIDIKGDESRRRDFSAYETLNIECSTRVSSRGWHALPPVQVNTRFPLGLLFSWSKPSQLAKKSLVYPVPAEWQEFPPRYSGNASTQRQSRMDNDDFSGLRQYRKGDSPQHIDWKTFARGKGLHSKEFSGGEMPIMVFRWSDTTGDKEHRISLLTRWVIEAGTQGISFGLKLPVQELAPSRSEKQVAKCLKLLALM